MTLGRLQAQHLLNAALLVQHATKLGFRVTGGERKRTEEQQRIYVRTGRSKTMLSLHLDSLADDFNFFKVLVPETNETWINGMTDKKRMLEIMRPLGEYWESLDPRNRWGGNFDKDWSRQDPWIDVPHFETQR